MRTPAHRLCVVGNSGSGKTTLARELGRRLGVEHIELDSLFHRAGWEPTPTEEFRTALGSRLAAAEARGGWVVDGNYLTQAADLTVGVADRVVWLDPSRTVVTRQVVARTWHRVRSGEELWNGNRERWQEVLSWDPERSIIRWSWTQHRRYHQLFGAMAAAEPERWLRVSSRRQREEVVRRLAGAP